MYFSNMPSSLAIIGSQEIAGICFDFFYLAGSDAVPGHINDFSQPVVADLRQNSGQEYLVAKAQFFIEFKRDGRI